LCGHGSTIHQKTLEFRTQNSLQIQGYPAPPNALNFSIIRWQTPGDIDPGWRAYFQVRKPQDIQVQELQVQELQVQELQVQELQVQELQIRQDIQVHQVQEPRNDNNKTLTFHEDLPSKVTYTIQEPIQLQCGDLPEALQLVHEQARKSSIYQIQVSEDLTTKIACSIQRSQCGDLPEVFQLYDRKLQRAGIG
jgi:hypothetical protein